MEHIDNLYILLTNNKKKIFQLEILIFFYDAKKF